MARTESAAGDHVEIAQLLQRYGHALDEKRFELLDTVFVPGAELCYDLGSGGKTTYPEMIEVFRRFLEGFYYTQHLISPPVIELGADRARSTCRLIATHVQLAPEGERNTWVVYGFYRDAHVRTAAGWRVRERLFRGVHTEGELLASDRVERFPTPPWRSG